MNENESQKPETSEDEITYTPLGIRIHPVSLLERIARKFLARKKKDQEQNPEAASTTSPPGRTELLARKYLEKVEPAISGQGGDAATYRVACKLIGGYGLSVDEAMPLIGEWNRRCDPPWSETDLRRKLERADSSITGERGWLARARDEITRQVGGGGGAGAVLKNHLLDEYQDGETMRRVVVGLSAWQIMADLYAMTDQWPRRVGGRLFVVRPGSFDPIHLDCANALFAWISGRERGSSNSVDWAKGTTCISRTEFFEYLRQEATCYRHIEHFPHEPPLPGHCYLHPELPPARDFLALDGLINRFNPSTPVDRDLILAYFLTLIWGGPAGSRPAFLITSEEDAEGGGRGSGKSTLLEMGALLVGGKLSVGSNADFESIKSRLLSSEGLRVRCLMLDNLKTLRYSCAEMESLITDPEISGKRLYHGEGSRPNHLITGITVNGANLSTDMAQRCVIIKVKRPLYQSGWLGGTRDYIEQNRWQIAADIVATLAALPPALECRSRWAEWEGAILSKVQNPQAAQELLTERREEADADEQETAETVEAIVRWLRDLGRDPDKEIIFIRSAELCPVLSEVAGEPIKPRKLTGFLSQRSVTQLKKYRHMTRGRGWQWVGPESKWDDPMIKTNGLPFDSETGENLDDI